MVLLGGRCFPSVASEFRAAEIAVFSVVQSQISWKQGSVSREGRLAAALGHVVRGEQCPWVSKAVPRGLPSRGLVSILGMALRAWLQDVPGCVIFESIILWWRIIPDPAVTVLWSTCLGMHHPRQTTLCHPSKQQCGRARIRHLPKKAGCHLPHDRHRVKYQ